MIHDLTNKPYTVYITYDVDFVPLHSALGKKMKPVKPVWMDVENGHAYPVFDVLRGSGTNGKFTFPDQATNPYPNGRQLNQWTLPYSGTLVTVAGHLHPGGLYDDLMVVRPGATVTRTKGGPVPGDVPHVGAHLPLDRALLRRPRARLVGRRDDRRPAQVAGSREQGRHPAAPPPPTTPSSARGTSRWGSWWPTSRRTRHSGVDPFKHAVTWKGRITHGHLPENNVHGATAPVVANPLTLPSGTAPDNTVKIENFKYVPGDLSASGQDEGPADDQAGSGAHVHQHRRPADGAVRPADLALDHRAARHPCNLNTGVSYPIANGAGGLRLRAARASGRSASRPSTSSRPGRRRRTCRRAPTRSSAGSTRSCVAPSG